MQSIDGLDGGESSGRRLDWFFYVNGIESPIGATQARVRGGDRIWWDYRDWTDAMSVPAVVGSWPQPFAAAKGKVAVDCVGATSPCRAARARLEDAGVGARIVAGAHPSSGPRLLIGPWPRIRRDSAAAQLASGPGTSGVFARFAPRRSAGLGLDLLDVRADVAEATGRATGLLAAVRDGERPPTWLVTGGAEAGVRRAARLLGTRDLRDRYAVAATGHAVVPLPVIAGSEEGTSG